jgi:hypothetical protein
MFSEGKHVMQKKVLIVSLVAGASALTLTLMVAVTVFALALSTSVQPERATLDTSLEIAPLQVEPVVHQPQVADPVFEIESASYADSYSDGDCPFSSHYQQVEAPPQDVIENDQLLTLAE